MTFMKTSQKMLKLDLILQIMNQIDQKKGKNKGENKIVIELMKDELFGIILMKFVELKAKTYSYLIDIGSDNKKAKGTKKCVTERKLKIYL